MMSKITLPKLRDKVEVLRKANEFISKVGSELDGADVRDVCTMCYLEGFAEGHTQAFDKAKVIISRVFKGTRLL
jgi:hypothetical protein